MERTLTMGRRFLWIAHNDGVVCATGTGLLARAELAAQVWVQRHGTLYVASESVAWHPPILHEPSSML